MKPRPIIFQFTSLSTVFGILLAVSCAREQDPVKRGERIFRAQDCQRCHAFGGRGVDWGPDLTMVGFRKSREWLDVWLKNPRAWHPITAMPTFRLKDAQREDLAAFLSAQKGQTWTGGKPWDAAGASMKREERGRLIFEKAGCLGCHGRGGIGGYPNNNVIGGQIPALVKAADGYSREEMGERIKHGAIPIPADPHAGAPLIRMPTWGEVLSDAEIADVVEYVYSLRPPMTPEEEW